MKSARCRAEVLLSAGAIQSPQLLQLSGIGPRALLDRHRHRTVCTTCPGVGENLQDHLQIRLGYECTKPITTNDQLNSWLGRIEDRPAVAAVSHRRRWRSASTRAAASCARCTTRTATPQPPRPTSSSTSRRCRPTWPAARCIRTPASRCRCASCGPSRAATSASARPIRSSRPRCSPTTCRPSSTGAPPSPA